MNSNIIRVKAEKRKPLEERIFLKVAGCEWVWFLGLFFGIGVLSVDNHMDFVCMICMHIYI